VELPEMGITFLEKLMHGDLVYSFLKSSFWHFPSEYTTSAKNQQEKT